LQVKKQQTKNLKKDKKKIAKQNMQQNCFQQQVTDTAELIPVRSRKIDRSNNKNFSQINRLTHLIKTELFKENM